MDLKVALENIHDSVRRGFMAIHEENTALNEQMIKIALQLGDLKLMLTRDEDEPSSTQEERVTDEEPAPKCKALTKWGKGKYCSKDVQENCEGYCKQHYLLLVKK